MCLQLAVTEHYVGTNATHGTCSSQSLQEEPCKPSGSCGKSGTTKAEPGKSYDHLDAEPTVSLHRRCAPQAELPQADGDRVHFEGRTNVQPAMLPAACSTLPRSNMSNRTVW